MEHMLFRHTVAQFSVFPGGEREKKGKKEGKRFCRAFLETLNWEFQRKTPKLRYDEALYTRLSWWLVILVAVSEEA